MALMGCPECGREVSSSAAVCPLCAFPLATVTPAPAAQAAPVPPGYEWWKTALSIVGRVALGAILAGIGGEEDSVAAIFGGAVIAGSAIPTWYRARIARLRAGRGSAELEHRFEGRMAALEQQQQDQMDRLERVHAAQLAELEERVDFAERLLSKHREQIESG